MIHSSIPSSQSSKLKMKAEFPEIVLPGVVPCTTLYAFTDAEHLDFMINFNFMVAVNLWLVAFLVSFYSLDPRCCLTSGLINPIR